MSNYSVLVISSYPPSRSGGLAQDMMSALENDGHKVDFFTMFDFVGRKENQYSIFPMPTSDRLKSLKKYFPFLESFRNIAKRFVKTPEEKMSSVEKYGYRIPHYDESVPPVSDEVLLQYLPDKHYDFIMIYVTERMLTTPSFITVYKKYKAPLLIVCMDMMHFTGGCYFFGTCKRFTEGCGKCLVLDSDNPCDQTHINYQIKASVYPKIEYAMLCNLYQKQFALQCKLFEDRRVFNLPILINENVFISHPEEEVRRYFSIPQVKKKILLSRYSRSLCRAKGYDRLVNIVNICDDQLSKEEKSKYVLVLIGSERDDEFASQIRMDTIFLGQLCLQDLIKVYSAATVFISTSIDDAGPSMVNQSMMCGTPVVTFSIGTALEVTREGVNGYKAANFDDTDFADKVLKITRKEHGDYVQMKKNTRHSAIEMNSMSVNAKRVIEIYNIIKQYN